MSRHCCRGASGGIPPDKVMCSGPWARLVRSQGLLASYVPPEPKIPMPSLAHSFLTHSGK